MDPDEALREIRSIIAEHEEAQDSEELGDDDDNEDNTAHESIDVPRLIDLIDGLDSWMMKGGFLPKSWADARDQSKDSRETKKAVAAVKRGLAGFSDKNPEIPDKRSIEDFYEAVRTLYNAGRIK